MVAGNDVYSAEYNNYIWASVEVQDPPVRSEMIRFQNSKTRINFNIQIMTATTIINKKNNEDLQF